MIISLPLMLILTRDVRDNDNVYYICWIWILRLCLEIMISYSYYYHYYSINMMFSCNQFDWVKIVLLSFSVNVGHHSRTTQTSCVISLSIVIPLLYCYLYLIGIIPSRLDLFQLLFYYMLRIAKFFMPRL